MARWDESRFRHSRDGFVGRFNWDTPVTCVIVTVKLPEDPRHEPTIEVTWLAESTAKYDLGNRTMAPDPNRFDAAFVKEWITPCVEETLRKLAEVV